MAMTLVCWIFFSSKTHAIMLERKNYVENIVPVTHTTTFVSCLLFLQLIGSLLMHTYTLEASYLLTKK